MGSVLPPQGMEGTTSGIQDCAAHFYPLIPVTFKTKKECPAISSSNIITKTFWRVHVEGNSSGIHHGHQGFEARQQLRNPSREMWMLTANGWKLHFEQGDQTPFIIVYDNWEDAEKIARRWWIEGKHPWVHKFEIPLQRKDFHTHPPSTGYSSSPPLIRGYRAGVLVEDKSCPVVLTEEHCYTSEDDGNGNRKLCLFKPVVINGVDEIQIFPWGRPEHIPVDHSTGLPMQNINYLGGVVLAPEGKWIVRSFLPFHWRTDRASFIAIAPFSPGFTTVCQEWDAKLRRELAAWQTHVLMTGCPDQETQHFASSLFEDMTKVIMNVLQNHQKDCAADITRYRQAVQEGDMQEVPATAESLGCFAGDRHWELRMRHFERRVKAMAEITADKVSHFVAQRRQQAMAMQAAAMAQGAHGGATVQYHT